MGFQNRMRAVVVALAGLSLAGLACGLGSIGQLQGQVEETGGVPEEVQALVEEQAAEVGISVSDTCPVLTNAEVQAATGQAVTLNVVVDTQPLLGCTFTTEGDTVSVRVYSVDTPESAAQLYEGYALVPGNQGQDVSGPWEQGRFSTQSGLFYLSGTNVVNVLTSQNANQAASVQMGTNVASRLPWTPAQ